MKRNALKLALFLIVAFAPIMVANAETVSMANSWDAVNKKLIISDSAVSTLDETVYNFNDLSFDVRVFISLNSDMSESSLLGTGAGEYDLPDAYLTASTVYYQVEFTYDENTYETEVGSINLVEVYEDAITASHVYENGNAIITYTGVEGATNYITKVSTNSDLSDYVSYSADRTVNVINDFITGLTDTYVYYQVEVQIDNKIYRSSINSIYLNTTGVPSVDPTTIPDIDTLYSGIDPDVTYYTSQTITFANVVKVVVNGTELSELSYTIPGDNNASYYIQMYYNANDFHFITVRTGKLTDYYEGNVKNLDISSVTSDDLDDINATIEVLTALGDDEEILDRIATLNAYKNRIEFVQGKLTEIIDGVTEFDVDTVKETDRATILSLISLIESTVERYDGNLTSDELDMVNSYKTTLNGFMTRLNAVIEAQGQILNLLEEIGNVSTSRNGRYDITDLNNLRELINYLNYFKTAGVWANNVTGSTYDQDYNTYNGLLTTLDGLDTELTEIDLEYDTLDATPTIEDIDDYSNLYGRIDSLLDESNEYNEYLRTEDIDGLTEKSESLTENINALSEVKDVYDSIVDNYNDNDIANIEISSANKEVLDTLYEEVNNLLETSADYLSASDVQSLNDILSSISEKRETINAIVESYSEITTDFETLSEIEVSNVTTDNEEELNAILDKVNTFNTAYSAYLTEEETNTVNSVISFVNDRIERIETVKGYLEEINNEYAQFATLTVDTVKDSNYEELDELLTKVTEFGGFTRSIENYRSNLTEEQIESLTEIRDNLAALVNQLGALNDALITVEASYEELSGSVTTENATTENASDINALEEAVNAIRTTYENNIEQGGDTDNRLSVIEGYTESINGVITSVEETIGNVNEAYNNIPTSETVKSTDVSAINALLDDIAALKETDLYNNNFTDEQKGDIESKETALNNSITLLNEIVRVIEAGNDLDVDTVTSADLDAINSLDELVNAINNDNLTDEEMETKIAALENIASAKERIETVVGIYSTLESNINSLNEDIEANTTVNLDDATLINSTIDTIDTLLNTYSSNLTAEELAAVNEYKDTVDAYSSFLLDIEAQISNYETNELASMDSHYVTSDNLDDINNLIAEIDTFVTNNSTYLGEIGINRINEVKDYLAFEKEIIEHVASIIDSIEGVLDFDIDAINADNVADYNLDELYSAATNLNEDEYYENNITAEEREILASVIEKIDNIRAVLSDVENEVAGLTDRYDVINALENITHDNYEDIVNLINDINAAMSTENALYTNYSETQKEELTTAVTALVSLKESLDTIADVIAEAETVNPATVTTENEEELLEIKAALEEIDLSRLNEEYLEDYNNAVLKVATALENIAKVKDALAYVVDNDSKLADVEALTEDLNALDEVLNSSNTTAEETAAISETRNTLNALIERLNTLSELITNIESAYENTTDVISNENIQNYASLEDDIEEVLTYSNNLTEDEIADLNSKKENVTSKKEELIQKKEILDELTSETEKTYMVDDMDELASLKEKLDAFINENSANISEEELNTLTTLKEHVDSEYEEVYDVYTKYTAITNESSDIFDNIKISDIDDINTLISHIDEINNSPRLTDIQKAVINGIKTSLNLAKKIATDIKYDYDKLSTDLTNINDLLESDIASLKDTIANAENFLDKYEDNISEEEYNEVLELKANAEERLAELTAVKESIDSIINSSIILDENTSEEALEEAINAIGTILTNPAVSDSSKALLNTLSEKLVTIYNKVLAMSSAEEILNDNIEAFNSKSTVTTDDINELVDLINDLKAYDETYNSNKYADAIEGYNELLDSLNAIIEETNDISNIVVPNATTQNKDKLLEIKDRITAALEGNITEEQREVLSTKLEEVNGKLEIVNTVDASFNGIINDYTLGNSEDLLERIDNLLANYSDNLLVTEKFILSNIKDNINKENEVIEKVNETYENIIAEEYDRYNISELIEYQNRINRLKENNLTEEQVEKLNTISEDVAAILLDAQKTYEDAINNASLDLANATIDDLDKLNNAHKLNEKALNSSTITDTQKGIILILDNLIQNTINKVTKLNNAVNEVLSKDASTVDELNNISNDISSLLANKDNLTEEQTKKLVTKKASVDEKIKSLTKPVPTEDPKEEVKPTPADNKPSNNGNNNSGKNNNSNKNNGSNYYYYNNGKTNNNTKDDETKEKEDVKKEIEFKDKSKTIVTIDDNTGESKDVTNEIIGYAFIITIVALFGATIVVFIKKK